MSSPIQNNPAFAAYSRLTVVSHFVARREGKETDGTNMSFKDFVNAIEKDQVVDEMNVRSTSDFQLNHSRVNAAFNGGLREQKTLSYINKAYELGMVDLNGTLISHKR